MQLLHVLILNPERLLAQKIELHLHSCCCWSWEPWRLNKCAAMPCDTAYRPDWLASHSCIRLLHLLTKRTALLQLPCKYIIKSPAYLYVMEDLLR
jgi:hypothetical protein